MMMKRSNQAFGPHPLQCLLVALLIPVGAAMAQPGWRYEGDSGGTGGSAFQDHIPMAAQLAEVRVWSWEWINAIQLVYRTRDGRMIETAVHGRDGRKDGNLDGDGGHLDVLSLRPDEWITGVEGMYGKFVNSITVTLNSGRSATFGRGGEHPYRFAAKRDEAIVGFQGRSSKYLDAIGVAYRDR